MKTLIERKAQLETRLDELKGRARRVKQELLSHQDPDWEDAALERENEEVLYGLEGQAEMEIQGIAAALQRIEQGTYGTCKRCGKAIDEARLDLLPATVFCKADAP